MFSEDQMHAVDRTMVQETFQNKKHFFVKIHVAMGNVGSSEKYLVLKAMCLGIKYV